MLVTFYRSFFNLQHNGLELTQLRTKVEEQMKAWNTQKYVIRLFAPLSQWSFHRKATDFQKERLEETMVVSYLQQVSLMYIRYCFITHRAVMQLYRDLLHFVCHKYTGVTDNTCWNRISCSVLFYSFISYCLIYLHGNSYF